MHACMKNLALNNLINYTEGAYKKKKKSISVCQANTGIQFAKMGAGQVVKVAKVKFKSTF